MPPAGLYFKLIYHPSLKSKSKTHHVQKTDKNLVSGKTDKYFFCWKKILLILDRFFALQLVQYEWAWIAELVLVRHRHGGPPPAYYHNSIPDTK